MITEAQTLGRDILIFEGRSNFQYQHMTALPQVKNLQTSWLLQNDATAAIWQHFGFVPIDTRELESLQVALLTSLNAMR